EDGIRHFHVTGVQTCALPILDIYRPTLETLKALVARVPRGGIIAFDELNHPDYPGETQAVMECIGIHNLKLRRLDISPMLSYARSEERRVGKACRGRRSSSRC